MSVISFVKRAVTRKNEELVISTVQMSLHFLIVYYLFALSLHTAEKSLIYSFQSVCVHIDKIKSFILKADFLAMFCLMQPRKLLGVL